MMTFTLGLLALAIRFTYCCIDGSLLSGVSMAPRSKIAAAGGVKGVKKDAILKPKLTAALAEDWPNKTDRWKGRPKAFCKSCSQYTSSIDKHSAPNKPVFLHWLHNRVSKAEVAAEQAKLDAKAKASAGKQGKAVKAATVKEADLRYPSGEECYPCYDVRRKWFKDLDQKQLIDKRKDQSQVDDQFNSYRHDSVSGENKFKGPKGKSITTVEKGSQEFDRNYVSGTFEPLDDFAAKRRLPKLAEAQLVALVREKYPAYTVVVQKDGTVCGIRLYYCGLRAQA